MLHFVFTLLALYALATALTCWYYRISFIVFFLFFFFLVNVFGFFFVDDSIAFKDDAKLVVMSLLFGLVTVFLYFCLNFLFSTSVTRNMMISPPLRVGAYPILFFALATLGFLAFYIKAGVTLDGDYNARIQKNAGNGALVILMYGYLAAIATYLVGGKADNLRGFLLISTTAIAFGGAYYLLIGGSRNLIAASLFIVLIWLIATKKIKIPVAAACGLVLFAALLLLEYYRYALSLEGFTFNKGLILFSESLSPSHAIRNIYSWLSSTSYNLQHLTTFFNEFAIVVPRAMWEDKPINFMNNGYYYTTQILGLDTNLTISPTLVGSAIIMFGEHAYLFSPICAVVLYAFDKMLFSRRVLLKSFALCLLPYVFFMVRDGLEVFLYVGIKFLIVFFLAMMISLSLKTVKEVSRVSKSELS
ncbi:MULTISPECIES: WzyE family oligosaccharide polymerase [Halomonas]|uniref:WzyE family oligosaccharide polymerase n=1 Tax=Halomonas TaxID=2745 RepID=UPI001C98D2E2|nr:MULTISPECIES: WzyE family oligosaccharide polymerase [Halomonas]MBY6208223.1 WzyE family oligosaccharide polymerase [Halomonas sp. DP3Y7-2]MBY6229032.1 WzyE family oligosaccharide polymerase [Halomonas sp. DP3Y7-1]MCA0916985.1 WzyE family oligosaccharide polymerase [Halomonas denitrificans]